MLIPNHPHDERLSALASCDPEALADAALSEHVASCVRCADAVAEVASLRATLAELPDLQPHRPLRLLPPVDDPAHAGVASVGGWARRFFAPMLTAGAALAIVGLVGTMAPSLSGMAASGGADTGAAPLEAAQASEDPTLAAGEAAPSEDPNALTYGPDDARASGEELGALRSDAETPTVDSDSADNQRLALSDEDRPIWPMLLFAGVAIMIAAALLRWILAPRAG
jgi:hypothetical protein